MKKIKIFLQYPWKFPDSPYYKYLIENPPRDVEYLNAENQKGVITKQKKFLISNRLKEHIRQIFYSFKISILNSHLTKTNKEYDLIQCAHCLSKNKNKRWVVDLEGFWQFHLGYEKNSLNKKIKKILLKRECKKIIAWTIKVKEDVLKRFPELKNKIEVVYPAISIPKTKRKKHKEINLVFIARYFYGKGGLHALETIDALTKEYENVRGIFVSEVPEEILKEYSKNQKIKFYGLLPQKKIFKEIFPISDIFVYPAYQDSFGFSMLEAMSFGVPVVTVKGFSRRELIEDGKTGFVINNEVKRSERNKHKKEIEEELIKKTNILIKDKKLREKFSRNCIDTIKKGKFSISKRNKKLRKIYEEALK